MEKEFEDLIFELSMVENSLSNWKNSQKRNLERMSLNNEQAKLIKQYEEEYQNNIESIHIKFSDNKEDPSYITELNEENYSYHRKINNLNKEINDLTIKHNLETMQEEIEAISLLEKYKERVKSKIKKIQEIE